MQTTFYFGRKQFHKAKYLVQTILFGGNKQQQIDKMVHTVRSLRSKPPYLIKCLVQTIPYGENKELCWIIKYLMQSIKYLVQTILSGSNKQHQLIKYLVLKISYNGNKQP